MAPMLYNLQGYRVYDKEYVRPSLNLQEGSHHPVLNVGRPHRLKIMVLAKVVLHLRRGYEGLGKGAGEDTGGAGHTGDILTK
jgi:hypothetical protein